MDLKKYLLAGGISSVLLLAACGDMDDSTSEEDTSDEAEAEDTNDDATEDTEDAVEEETETSEENLSIGDTAELDDVTVTIDDAYYSDERNEFAEVEVDSVLILDVSFENNTGEDYSPAFDFEVYADGSKAEEYPVGDVILDSVSDGRSSSGSIAFGIVGEPSEIELEFSPFMSFSGEKAIFNVMPE